MPTAYDHPSNPKIKFWDLPGIGTPNYPDLETYTNGVELEKYHAFLIFTATRFTDSDKMLAKKIRSIDKKFFFIRTKIDLDVQNESRRKRSFNEDAMLEKIRCDCLKNLGNLMTSERDIFLISNHDRDKWDFDRLTMATLDALPTLQQESLILSLGQVTRSVFERKVNVLKRRVWMAAAASAAVALVPVPGLSVGVDIALLLHEVTFYRKQLGLPQIGSAQFIKLNFTTQEQVRRLFLTTTAQLVKYISMFAAGSAIEEVARFIPFVGSVIASGISFAATYLALKSYLKRLEETVLLTLAELTQKSIEGIS